MSTSTPPLDLKPTALAVPTGDGGAVCASRRLDIIGDVHGCLDELRLLLYRLGWSRTTDGRWRHPERRVLVFVGDLVNRGPASWGVLGLVHDLIRCDAAVMVLGNHDVILRDTLDGSLSWNTPSLKTTMQTLERMRPKRAERARQSALAMFNSAPLWLHVRPEAPHDDAELVIVHACWHPALPNIDPELRESTCVYGPTVHLSGHRRPFRLDWRPHYPDDAPFCVHGHVAYDGPVRLGAKSVCIDTGCVFGGRLTALRWPERETVQVKAQRPWAKYPNIPLTPALVAPENLPSRDAQRIAWPWADVEVPSAPATPPEAA